MAGFLTLFIVLAFAKKEKLDLHGRKVRKVA